MKAILILALFSFAVFADDVPPPQHRFNDTTRHPPMIEKRDTTKTHAKRTTTPKTAPLPPAPAPPPPQPPPK